MRYLLIIFFIFFELMAYAGEQPANDSSRLELRNFSASSIDKYKKDKAFIYNVETIEQPSLWDRFWAWFWQKIRDIMSTKEGENTVYTVLIIFGVAALAFLVFKISRMNKTNLFSKGGNGAMKYSVEEENINTIDFEGEIAKALQNGNYRLAIRMVYLQNLKLLSDKEIIDWQPNKTNYDYAGEIKVPAVKPLFMRLTDIFEYAWYGNASTGNDVYVLMREKFIEIKNTLN